MAQKRAGSQFYVPDFSLRVDDRCVYFKIDRDLWRNGVIKSNYERVNNHLSDSIEYIPAATGPNDDPASSTANLPISSMNDLSANTSNNSPHRQVTLKKFKDSTAAPSLLAPPGLARVGAGQGGRRSTITVNVLSKAQDMMAKSLNKLSHSRLALHEDSTLAESMKEVNNEDEDDDRTGLISSSGADSNHKKQGRFLVVNSAASVNQNEACRSESASLALPSGANDTVNDDVEEKEPFMHRSTFSLNLLTKEKRHHDQDAAENVSMDEKYNPISQM